MQTSIDSKHELCSRLGLILKKVGEWVLNSMMRIFFINVNFIYSEELGKEDHDLDGEGLAVSVLSGHAHRHFVCGSLKVDVEQDVYWKLRITWIIYLDT